MQKLAAKSKPLSNERFGKIPSIIKPSVGLVNVASLAVLTNRYHVSGRKWVTQFPSAFRIMGELCRRYVYPADDKDWRPTVGGPIDLFEWGVGWR